MAMSEVGEVSQAGYPTNSRAEMKRWWHAYLGWNRCGASSTAVIGGNANIVYRLVCEDRIACSILSGTNCLNRLFSLHSMPEPNPVLQQGVHRGGLVSVFSNLFKPILVDQTFLMLLLIDKNG